LKLLTVDLITDDDGAMDGRRVSFPGGQVENGIITPYVRYVE